MVYSKKEGEDLTELLAFLISLTSEGQLYLVHDVDAEGGL